MMKFWRKKGRLRRFFLDHGSAVLEELVDACDGKTNPIRSFSSDQILKATKNFDPSCVFGEEGGFTFYKGSIEDRFYIIKKFSYSRYVPLLKRVCNDVVMSARMSNHKNFLKLLGWCLEFPFLVLVFEYAENGCLDRQIRRIGSQSTSFLPWNVRLKIAKEIANAVTYLHTAFPRIIIHTDINPMHVLLDKNWTAKLSDLSFSVSLPEGKSRIEVDIVRGTIGYLDPSYLETRLVTEYIDVYSFGIFLMVLLTGKAAMDLDKNWLRLPIPDYVTVLREDGEFIGVADEEKDVTAGQRSQMEAFLDLALRGCEKRQEDRPKMIEVAKELKRIERSLDARSTAPS